MDYKKLIFNLRDYAEQYKSGSTLGRAIVETEDVMFAAADAIETLLAERDAAIEESRGDCKKCRFTNFGSFDFPCFRCVRTGGKADYWEWRGPQKGGGV